MSYHFEKTQILREPLVIFLFWMAFFMSFVFIGRVEFASLKIKAA